MACERRHGRKKCLEPFSTVTLWKGYILKEKKYCLIAKSCLTLCNPMDYSPPGSLSMGFPKQEYWGGLPCLPRGDCSDKDIEPTSPELTGRFFFFFFLNHSATREALRKKCFLFKSGRNIVVSEVVERAVGQKIKHKIKGWCRGGDGRMDRGTDPGDLIHLR